MDTKWNILAHLQNVAMKQNAKFYCILKSVEKFKKKFLLKCQGPKSPAYSDKSQNYNFYNFFMEPADLK